MADSKTLSPRVVEHLLYGTLGYVVKGYFGAQAARSEKLQFDMDRAAHPFETELEAMVMCGERATDMAVALAAIQTRWPEIEYPGVIDYEVTEPLGEYLFGFEGADDWQQCYTHIADELALFLLPDGKVNAGIPVTAMVMEASRAIWQHYNPTPDTKDEGQTGM